MAENVFTGDASNYAEGDGMLDLNQEQRAFIEEVAYYANQEYSRRKAAGEDWVLPSVCVAQACLESGFGSATTVNIFGIKGEGTTAVTSEEYTIGQHTTITDSFVSHGTIEDDVKVYYDLICGTGNYEGWDIYSAARNNEDPEAAIREIKNAGYATSSTYTENVTSILNQYNLRQFDTGIVDFEYNEAGYQEGCDAYDDAVKIITEMEQSLEKAENSIKSACSAKPAVDYQSIIQFEEMKSTIQTLKELLEKTKMIAEEEKYLAEQYNDDGGAGLDAFQVASMAATVQNFAFDDINDFKTMVSSYQKSSSNEVFSNWLQSYVSTNGIESKVVNMSQYEKAIKDSGAVLSSDYVVSKVSFLLADTTKEEEKEKDKDEDKSKTTTNGSSQNGSTQFRATGGGTVGGVTGGTVSGRGVTSTISEQNKTKSDSTLKTKKKEENDDKTTDETKKTTEKTTTDDSEQTSNETLKSKEVDTTTDDTTSTVTTTSDGTTNQNTTFTQTTTTSESQPVTNQTVYSSNTSDVVPSEESYQTEPEPVEEATSTDSELPIDLEEEEPVVPVDSDLYENGTGESTVQQVPIVPSVPSPKPSQSTGSAVIPVALGLGATAAVGGGAAYYIHKKHQDDGYAEYDDEEVGEDDGEYADDYMQEDEPIYDRDEEDIVEEKAIPELNEINDGDI